MKSILDERSDRRVVLEAVDLWKSYDDGAVTVLKGIDFQCFEGHAVALCGPSGCGKSTLLHLFAGLDKPESGRVLINGAELTTGRNHLNLLRFEIGFVFQLHNLIPGLTLAENCLLPSFAAGVPRRQAEDRLRELAESTGLTHRINHPIQKLSGGERQRTALCRALMNRPRILLADEPTGSLDEQNSHLVFDLLIQLAAIENVTLLMATHDRNLAAKCDRTVEMHDGRIKEFAYAH
jgi:lipoprotein-releasing system ATP-binding protein